MIDRGTVAERLGAQGLTGAPAKSALAVAERLLAIQGQDPRGARLAVRARSTELSAADVDRALSEERSLLITWLNRGTLHLVRSEDYPWLQKLTTPPLRRANARRLEEEGVSAGAAERGVEVIARALAAEGPLTRAELRDRLDSAGVPTAGQALIHLLIAASLRGIVVRGPLLGKQHAFVLVSDWLPPPPALDRDAALAELARRYLAGHGPANDRDLAKWSGLGLRDVRAGLGAISGELEEREDGLLRLADAISTEEIPPPRLLGPFDPVLHGWASREFVLGEHTDLVTINGIFRAFAMVDGRAAALWSLRSGELSIDPLAQISARDSAALRADAEAVVRYLEGV